MDVFVLVLHFELFFTIFCLKIQDEIWALWSNETGKESLSKVVQQGRIYMQLEF